MPEQESRSPESVRQAELVMELAELREKFDEKSSYVSDHPEDSGAQRELEILEADIVNVQMKLERLETL